MVKNLPAVWETQVQSLGREDALKNRTANHSSILAWKISWTEEPSGLQSMGSQRVGHNWATSLSFFLSIMFNDFPGSSAGKESTWNAGDLGSILGSGRSSGAGTGNPLQYSCLENFMDRGAWRAIVHGVTKVWYNLLTKPPPPWRLCPKARRSPGGGNGNPFQYSCLENSTVREAWWAIVHGVTKSWTWLSDSHFHFFCSCTYSLTQKTVPQMGNTPP